MKLPSSGLRIDSPSFPLLQAHISYQGITTGLGNALGTTLVDALCSTAGLQPSYTGLSIKLLDGNAAGAVRQIVIHALATGIITVSDPWTDFNGALYQVPAATRFVILSAAGGGGAPAAVLAPSIGLWMFGECDPAQVASTTVLTLTNLAGFPNDVFNDEFWIQVIHNFNAVGTAPEREIRRVTDYVSATGTFTTDAFSANVEANDLVCVFHESILSIEILGFGTLTVSSATVPADAGRAALYAWENNNYFRGCLFMPTEGVDRFQPRRIVEFTVAGGIFTLDPNNPLSQAPGLIDYVIIRDQAEFVPAVDAVINRTPSDVIGNKTDTADYTAGAAASSIMRLVKGILNVKVIAEGTLTTSSQTVPADNARAEGNDHFKGCFLMPVAGAIAWQPRPIRAYTGAGGIFTLDEPFTALPGLVAYVVIASDYPVQRLIDIFNIVNAILVSTETGGIFASQVAETNVYINNAPAGVWEPLVMKIDFTAQTAAETTVWRVYYRLIAGGGWILFDTVTYAGVITPAGRRIALDPDRFGVRVTCERTAGAQFNYTWEVLART